jgi:hypothetical protein
MQTSVHRAKIGHPPIIATRPPRSSHHAAHLTTTRTHRPHQLNRYPWLASVTGSGVRIFAR